MVRLGGSQLAAASRSGAAWPADEGPWLVAHGAGLSAERTDWWPQNLESGIMKEFGRKLALVVALALFVLQLGIYFVPFSDGAAVAELAALDAATMVVLGALSRLVQRRIARRQDRGLRALREGLRIFMR